MNAHDGLTERFERRRASLRGIAYRMLGSPGEADDAVQEAWLRLGRADVDGIENLDAWLTTVVSRVCLDVLRSRPSRREDLVAEPAPGGGTTGPGPDERVAFVLHDMFAVPFADIAPIVGRGPVATKKLASRARRRVRGTPRIDGAALARQRHVIEAFVAASRAGDVDAVLAVLAPDVVRRADRAALAPGRATEVRGRRAVADEIVGFGRNARYAAPALVDGTVGLVIAPRGRLQLALTLAVERDQIVAYELIADPASPGSSWPSFSTPRPRGYSSTSWPWLYAS